MQFLANENFPKPSISLLREMGFYAISVAEDFLGLTDEQVLSTAVQNDLVVLTFDRDYGELLFRYRMLSVAGVVYFRDVGQNPSSAGEALKSYLNEGRKLENFFTVFDSGGVRQRKIR